MQRDIEAIVVAHKMDSARRELYVEGRRDRFFFVWLLGTTRNTDALVQEIDGVKMQAPQQGGRRAKVLELAAQVQPHNVAIGCFVDADFARLSKTRPPTNVWFTDLRDLEGYFLQIPCIEKVLQLGVVSEKVTASRVLKNVISVTKPLGLLRYLSDREDLHLPFQDRPLKKYLEKNGDEVVVDFDRYLRALLQGAGVSLRRLPEIKRKLATLDRRFKTTPHIQLVHGKDCVAVLTELLKCDNLKENAVEPSFWTSLERDFLQQFKSLQAALNFLQAA
jgi:hypothetical protein